MSEIIPERMTAQIDGDFVVFLIGVRINKLWRVRKWWPVTAAMSRMTYELKKNPELGFLGHVPGFKVSVQYWRSFEHLEAYAKNKSHLHLPAWGAFNQSIKDSRGAVGVWHETYLVGAGNHESVYIDMPEFGLGKAADLVNIEHKTDSAKSRIAANKL